MKKLLITLFAVACLSYTYAGYHPGAAVHMGPTTSISDRTGVYYSSSTIEATYDAWVGSSGGGYSTASAVVMEQIVLPGTNTISYVFGDYLGGSYAGGDPGKNEDIDRVPYSGNFELQYGVSIVSGNGQHGASISFRWW